METKLQYYPPPAVATAPTTFVEADATSFKDLVQMLTGLDGHSPKPLSFSSNSVTGPRRSPFKRRNVKAMRKLDGLQNYVVPSPVRSGSGFSHCQSPDTADNGLATPRGSDPPELLTLFPLSSPTHPRRSSFITN